MPPPHPTCLWWIVLRITRKPLSVEVSSESAMSCGWLTNDKAVSRWCPSRLIWRERFLSPPYRHYTEAGWVEKLDESVSGACGHHYKTGQWLPHSTQTKPGRWAERRFLDYVSSPWESISHEREGVLPHGSWELELEDWLSLNLGRDVI